MAVALQDKITQDFASTVTWTLDVSTLTFAAGDFLLIQGVSDSTWYPTTIPAGWQMLVENPNSGTQTVRPSWIMYKHATAGEPASYAFDMNASSGGNITLTQWRAGSGAVQVDFAEPSVRVDDPDPWNIPGFTTRIAGTVLAIFNLYDGTGVGAAPALAGWTLEVDTGTNTSESWMYVRDTEATADEVLPTLDLPPALAADELTLGIPMMMVLSDAPVNNILVPAWHGGDPDGQNTGFGTTVALLVPPVVDGDLLFYWGIIRSGTIGVTLPAGFTTLVNEITEATTNGFRVVMGWKVASSEPASYDLVTASSTAFGGRMFVVPRADLLTDPVVSSISIADSVSASTTPLVPTATTTVRDAISLWFVGFRQTSLLYAYPDDFSLSSPIWRTSGASQVTISTGFQKANEPRVLGTIPVTMSASGQWMAFRVTLELLEDPWAGGGAGAESSFGALYPLLLGT